ncbi:MAG: GatB/YqeY domain-containing protein [Burkholderiales bacterium]|nr:GatB/YqeY domain-containing protein [Burkholderiales bacterium]
MSLKERITEDMKAAMRAKDARRLSAIRLLLAGIKQVEIDRRVVLADADVVAVVEKEIKKRRDAIEQYRAAKRDDLAAAEEFEAETLAVYLPQQADEGEIVAVVDAAVAAAGGGPAAMGKVMAAVRNQLAGRADMTRVAQLVKARLAG